MMLAPSYTAKGELHDIADLKPRDIDWRGMAQSLSQTMRFNGQGLPSPISVAQHCVMGADALMREHGDATLAALFLLHDAHEWRFGDMTRPAVELLRLCMAQAGDAGSAKLFDAALEDAKLRLDRPIYKAASLPAPDRWPARARSAVKTMDERMLVAEIRVLFGAEAVKREAYTGLRASRAPDLAEPLKPWPPARAEEAFLDRLKRYAEVHWRV